MLLLACNLMKDETSKLSFEFSFNHRQRKTFNLIEHGILLEAHTYLFDTFQNYCITVFELLVLDTNNDKTHFLFFLHF